MLLIKGVKGLADLSYIEGLALNLGFSFLSAFSLQDESLDLTLKSSKFGKTETDLRIILVEDGFQVEAA